MIAFVLFIWIEEFKAREMVVELLVFFQELLVSIIDVLYSKI